ncbi:MAG: Mov34/MPN/PAD-1 family protein [Candidatus Sulfotelmatobacter sp.]
MQLLLTPKILKRLRRELRRAGEREIGGLLMGEHVHDEVFRVVDLSVQRAGGTEACFIRDPANHKAQLDKFFARTGGDYTRFNYLGEWHSHPTFEALPSPKDIRTMQSLVSDPAVGVNFLVLLVARLSIEKQIEATAMAFTPVASPTIIPISAEASNQNGQKQGFYGWLRSVFRL